jgi:predicted oxidoreductase (fatty acid repression mutant protein)
VPSAETGKKGSGMKSIQFWDDKIQPSAHDAFRTLSLALSLLADALPVALKHIGSETIVNQTQFWESFQAFDIDSDLTSYNDYASDPAKAVTETLNEWHEIAQLHSADAEPSEPSPEAEGSANTK